MVPVPGTTRRAAEHGRVYAVGDAGIGTNQTVNNA
jgi:hypothetical protein